MNKTIAKGLLEQLETDQSGFGLLQISDVAAVCFSEWYVEHARFTNKMNQDSESSDAFAELLDGHRNALKLYLENLLK